MKGLGKVELNDIVVFNYPAGDTIAMDMKYQAQDYYQMCYMYGEANKLQVDSLSPQARWDAYHEAIARGANYLKANPAEFGVIDSRPTDRRENYVKRCVGLPGQTLQIKNKIVYLDGKANKEPDNVQYSYHLNLKQMLPEQFMEEYAVTMEDIQSLNTYGVMPMTHRAAEALSKRTDLADNVRLVNDSDRVDSGKTYPVTANTGWTRDNYGPIWIPAKGESIDLTLKNLPIYERPIRTYEGNKLEVKDGKIYINDKETTKYTFKMDYYWMQGDNRHNSLDSRYWGFVPEDHIVGKPIFIWWSSDPDRNGFSGIRWNRLFRFVDNIK